MNAEVRREDEEPKRHNSRQRQASPVQLLALVAVATVALCLDTPRASATDHSGTITSNETWYAADNPHVIVGNVTVDEEVALTIEDQVNVLLEPWVEVRVRGSLTAEGSAGGGIVFSGPEVGTQLLFEDDGSGTFAYCTIDGLGCGIRLTTTGTVSVGNTTI